MIRLPPKSTRTDTLCPYTTLVRSLDALAGGQAGRADRGRGIDPLPRIVRHRCRKRFQPFGRQPLILFPRPATAALYADFAWAIDDQLGAVGRIEEGAQRRQMMIENRRIETHRRNLSE